jgi:hypothetical protein
MYLWQTAADGPFPPSTKQTSNIKNKHSKHVNQTSFIENSKNSTEMITIVS